MQFFILKNGSGIANSDSKEESEMLETFYEITSDKQNVLEFQCNRDIKVCQRLVISEGSYQSDTIACVKIDVLLSKDVILHANC